MQYVSSFTMTATEPT